MLKYLPVIALVFAAIFWGIAFPAFKVAIHIPPFSYAWLRFAIAFSIACPLYLCSHYYQPVLKKDLKKIAWTGLFGVTLNIGFLFIGVRLTQVAQAAVITSLTPVITIFAAALFLEEKLTARHIIGALICCLGAIVVIGSPVSMGALNSTTILGNGLILLSVASWVAFNILSKELFEKYSPFTITIWSFLVGCLSFIPFTVAEWLAFPNWPTTVVRADIISVLYYAICGTVLAYTLYTYGLAKTSADFASITQHISPLVTIVVALLFLGENLGQFFFTGAVVLFVGILLSTLPISIRVLQFRKTPNQPTLLP